MIDNIPNDAPSFSEPATNPAPVEVKPPEPARRVAVVGEIPFSGLAVTRMLLKKGFSVRVLCPTPQIETSVRAEQASVGPDAELDTVIGDVGSAEALKKVTRDVYAVCFFSPINLYGRMYRPDTHLEDVRRVIEASQYGAIRKLVYHSSLGAYKEATSQTMRDSASAEELIHAAKCEDYRIRTGPLMGRGDGFLTDMIRLAQSPLPVQRVLGYGDTVVQPIHVDDMARCVARLLKDSPTELQANSYALGGPEVVKVLDLMDSAAEKLHKLKLKVHVPLFVLKMIRGVVSAEFREESNLLFDAYYTDQNDAPSLLEPGQELRSIRQVEDEIALARS